MEQYKIQDDCYFKNIQIALKYYQVEYIFIRYLGSVPQHGKVVVSQNLENMSLTVHKQKKGLAIKINQKKVFHFEITEHGGRQWYIAYERIDNDGRMHMAHTGYPNPYEPYTGPDDPTLPEVEKTILRSGNFTHMIEITFSGKIPIKNVGLAPGFDNWYDWEINHIRK